MHASSEKSRPPVRAMTGGSYGESPSANMERSVRFVDTCHQTPAIPTLLERARNTREKER